MVVIEHHHPNISLLYQNNQQLGGKLAEIFQTKIHDNIDNIIIIS